MAGYYPPFILRNPDLNTIAPNILRPLHFDYTPQRLDVITRDHDFLELDIYDQASKKAVIVSHGLGGHARRVYVRGMLKGFLKQGYDGYAWNARGSGDKENLNPRFTHSGAFDDLEDIIRYVNTKKVYEEIILVGFSLGGNVTLRYLEKASVPDSIRGAICISVPVDLKGCSYELMKKRNTIYTRMFLKRLRLNLEPFERKYPDIVSLKGYENLKSLKEFDDVYVAPLHGFKDAHDYYDQCSSLKDLRRVSRPTLLINALDDPFLSKSCYPEVSSVKNNAFFVDYPAFGGHVGFGRYRMRQPLWTEERAVQFAAFVTKNY